MVLDYLTKKDCSDEAEVNESQQTFEPTDGTKGKLKGKMVFCFLCVAVVFVLNITYNFSVVAKGTPILQTITKNPIFDFGGTDKENPRLRNEAINNVGVVKGILYTENDPTALIGIKIIHEGDVISGSTVIKIHKDRVEFEKDGFSWTQHVMEKAELR